MEGGEGGRRRKEKRKEKKKEKRKKKRREIAEKNKEHEESLLNDPHEQARILLDEERETLRLITDRSLFDERERLFLLHLQQQQQQQQEEEEEEGEAQLLLNQIPHEDADDSDWEYVEDGLPEIIWQGNEIIVQKKKVKVKRKDADQRLKIEGHGRPTSNPFPPEFEPSVDSKNGSVLSAQQILDNTAQQIPNFGTEQDKAHCPFQIKTGACRFGLRCSRLHFYPDKSCTLLIKNMYNGPGLAFEQDEGLEHTDEEVDSFFEEFYEDVHTEFLKFGEIVNFKVCKNSSLHLRGNLYVHYKSEDSAMLAYQTVTGRYFAGKQVTCEFVGVTKWRVAICGEFMRSRLKTCSRGTACNFIHCFRNPGGDYEWADWDKPPPKYWVQEMAALFGHSQHSSDRSSSKRSLSRERKSYSHRHEDYDSQRSWYRKMSSSRSRNELEHHQSGYGVYDSDSDRDQSNCERGQDRHHDNTRRSISILDNQDYDDSKTRRSDSDSYWSEIDKEKDRKRKRDQDSDRKRDEDMHYRPNGKSSTPKRKRSDIWDITHNNELMVEDKDRKRFEDMSPYRKSRDKRDSINNSESTVEDKGRKKDEAVQYHPKGKNSTPKLKSRENRDSADDKEYMVEDKSGIRDESVYCKPKRKGSTSKRKSRDKYWDNANDSKLMLERDESKSRKHSRKSSRHSNEERDLREVVERRGRWDDNVGVENCKTC